MRINLLEKKIRAEVIKSYMEELHLPMAVCMTCGNTAKALREVGVEVDAVGANEEIGRASCRDRV